VQHLCGGEVSSNSRIDYKSNGHSWKERVMDKKRPLGGLVKVAHALGTETMGEWVGMFGSREKGGVTLRERGETNRDLRSLRLNNAPFRGKDAKLRQTEDERLVRTYYRGNRD